MKNALLIQYTFNTIVTKYLEQIQIFRLIGYNGLHARWCSSKNGRADSEFLHDSMMYLAIVFLEL